VNDVSLERERDFLLRSLDDLEEERAAGSIDDESYRALHDDYTARAAAVIRALRDGVDARPTRPPASLTRRLTVIGGLVAFALVAGVALAYALGARLPGQTASGNSAASSPPAGVDQRTRLEAVVRRDPDDVASRLLLARHLEADDDLPGALAQYSEVTRIDPTNADAFAQLGRILYLTAAEAPPGQASDLVDTARARLDHSIELDPDFAPARFFRAIVLANEFGDFQGAQADLQRYLVAEPDGTFADQARQLLADVTNALESPPPAAP
jgi:cytochrome c-type biogenesis protein CcmH/NrfG